MKKKILITGHDGFIGAHLVRALKNKYSIILPPPKKNDFDIRIKKHVLKLPKSDLVIHLAAIANVPISWKKPKKVLETNILGTLNVLEYARTHNSSLIYPGSYSYGNPQYLPIDEKHPVSTNNPYAVSKLAAEELCKNYSKNYALNTTILRIFNPYGPHQSENMVISHIIKEIINSSTATVFSGKPKRDFLYIDDLINAFQKTIDSNLTGYSIFNIGLGKSNSIKEIANKLKRISKKDVKYVDKKIERPNEIHDTIANIKKAKKVLNWKPQISLNKGLKLTYEWFKNRDNYS